MSGVLDLLASLVDKSLVPCSKSGTERLATGCSETVRQYASEMLEEKAEEAERIRRRHASRYLALAEEAEPGAEGDAAGGVAGPAGRGSRQSARGDQVGAGRGRDRDSAAPDRECGSSQIPERLPERGKKPAGGCPGGRRRSHAARAKALTEVGWFALEQSDYEQAQRLLEESLIMFRELGDTYGVAHALECLVVAKTRGSEYGRAAQLGEESLALYRELGHKWGIAMSLTNLGILAQEQGEYERATAHHSESLKLLRVLGDSLSVGYVLRLLGQSSLMQGQLERSAQFLEESQVLLSRLGDKPTLATTLCNLGETMLRQGDGARAAAVYKESLALAAQVGSKATVAGCLEGLGEVALTLVQPARAARLWGAAEALREAIGMSLGHQNRANYDYEGRIAAARSRLDEAAWAEGRAMTLEQAVEYALEPPEPPDEAEEAPPAYPAGLSAREVEVLKLVAQGMTDSRIAEELYISPRTVNAHLRSVYYKIGSSTRAEATRFALEHDLLMILL